MKSPLLLLLALALCVVCAGKAPHSYCNPAIAPFKASDRANTPSQNTALFIGSSSIEHWKTVAADFPEVKVINRGFDGSELGGTSCRP
jgi:hypothetical protein